MNENYKFMLTVIETKRKLLGMSKAELARRMDMDSVTLGTMLRGQRIIYADEALRLCVHLDISPTDLMSPELRNHYYSLWGNEI
ncbi:helix-turn-helix domain-containing protein [Adlercreutzia sp. ZJ304]|uniref:helix-turn-helix domain-containing protein n=1 Tax=Adlercreutzia sp. ZJ304 TaxID=2709791 RepID=UPI0013ECA70D|nr:helix-turn-helix domain-containing protein [Adlercreutzia sp. ZJ304]